MSNNQFRNQVNECINKKISEKMKFANAHLLNNIKQDTEPLVPYKTGELSNSVEIDYANNTIRYTADHAGYVYENEGANFNKSVHPQAQAYWLRDSIAINKEKWLKDYESDMKK